MSEQVGQDPARAPRIEEWLRSKGASGCPLCGLDAWKYDEVRSVIVLGARDVRDVGVGAGLRVLRSQQRGIRQAADFSRRYEFKCGNCGNVVLLDAKTVEGEAATTQPAEPQ